MPTWWPSFRGTIPPICQASIRTLYEPLERTRCMLGSSQSEPCNLLATSGDVALAKSLVIKHHDTVARNRR